MTTETLEERKARMARVRSFRQPRVRGVTDEEVFLATSQGPQRTSTDIRLNDEEREAVQAGNVEHERPGVVMMWKPGADGRYTPRVISETSKGLNLKNGWLIHCPDCGTNHEHSDLPPGDPNACRGREPVAIRICPVCGKRIPDNMGYAEVPDTGDPNVIRDEAFTNSTPASRTRVQLNIHLWERHPRQAQMMNIDPVPQSFANPSLPGDRVPVGRGL